VQGCCVTIPPFHNLDATTTLVVLGEARTLGLRIQSSGEPTRASRYSDWLRAGRPMGQNSSPGRIENFLISTSSRPVLGPTQPSLQWVPGALFLGVKRPGREPDHSPPSAEVKNTWIYTFTPLYVFMAYCLIS
jgi:hypothetical protein